MGGTLAPGILANHKQEAHMLSVETFDTIQARRKEMAGQAYKPRQFNKSDERFLTEETYGGSAGFMRRLDLVSIHLLFPGTERAKLPPEANFYQAQYTSPSPVAELRDEADRSLSVFPIRRRVPDMGYYIVHRLVLTDKVEADVSLLDEVPITVSWVRPSRVAVESPLLYNPDARYAWQHIVGQILDELEAGLQARGTGS